MAAQPIKLFITGDPGCGKTTLIQHVVERLQDKVSMRGFLTREIVEGGKRVGFCGETLEGKTFPLATRSDKGEFRVGPYSVDLAGLESVGLESLSTEDAPQLIVLDEVGKMESFSAPFRQQVEALLDGPHAVLGTVAAIGVGFVKKVRHDRRVTLVRMRREGRDGLVGEIVRRLQQAGIGVKAPRA